MSGSRHVPSRVLGNDPQSSSLLLLFVDNEGVLGAYSRQKLINSISTTSVSAPRDTQVTFYLQYPSSMFTKLHVHILYLYSLIKIPSAR